MKFRISLPLTLILALSFLQCKKDSPANNEGDDAGPVSGLPARIQTNLEGGFLPIDSEMLIDALVVDQDNASTGILPAFESTSPEVSVDESLSHASGACERS